MTNREKIIFEAKKLFNKTGYGAVTLFEIAQTSGISRGNITYHFKDKDRILEAISVELFEKIENEKYKTRQLPSFENLHNEAVFMYEIQKEYSFIFLDTLVQNHQLIKSNYQKVINEYIEDYKAAIAFSIQQGNMQKEPVQGVYNNIALICWMIAFYWMPQQIARGDKPKFEGEKIVWSILIPHFTEKGIKAFKNYFGEKYYNSLGKPFNMEVKNLISF